MTFLPPIFFSPFDYILARDFVYEIFSKLVSNSPRYSKSKKYPRCLRLHGYDTRVVSDNAGSNKTTRVRG